jgi:FkbM family methyltransferase
MYGGGDPAYVSSLPMKGRDAFTTVLNITQDTLDNIWVEAGRPTVSVLKVDVEGAELEVLMGAQQMMESCHPTLLCEANSIEHLHRLSDYLRVRGYDVYQPHGFERWN